MDNSSLMPRCKALLRLRADHSFLSDVCSPPSLCVMRPAICNNVYIAYCLECTIIDFSFVEFFSFPYIVYKSVLTCFLPLQLHRMYPNTTVIDIDRFS